MRSRRQRLLRSYDPHGNVPVVIARRRAMCTRQRDHVVPFEIARRALPLRFGRGQGLGRLSLRRRTHTTTSTSTCTAKE